MSEPVPQGKKLSFQEFKLFYESTEKVTDRRIATNRWNYSICLGILVAIAAVTQWGLTTPLNFTVGVLAIVLLSAMAIVFCVFWVEQIEDFKSLNNAKFAVLNEMAPHVAFDLRHPDQVVSFCPFEKEWKKMEDLNALRQAGGTQLIVLKSSNVEYFIPKAFMSLYTIVLVGAIVMVVAVAISGLPAISNPTPKPSTTQSTKP